MTIACPHCEKRIANSPAVAGRVVKCPHCNRQFSMPQLEAPPIMSQTLRANVWLRRMLGRNGGKPNKAVFWLGGTVLLLIILIIGSSLTRQKEDTLLSEDFRERAMTRDLKRERESLANETCDSFRGERGLLASRELLVRQTYDSLAKTQEERLKEEQELLKRQTQSTLKIQQARRKELISRIEHNKKKAQEIDKKLSKLFQEIESLNKKLSTYPAEDAVAAGPFSNNTAEVIRNCRRHARANKENRRVYTKYMKKAQDMEECVVLHNELSEKRLRTNELESAVREHDYLPLEKDLRRTESLIRRCQDTLQRLRDLEQLKGEQVWKK